jgi:hypothetical protein
MERGYERLLGTALVAIGLGLLLYGFVQAYDYGTHPPGGTYNVFSAKGGNSSGNNSLNITFNGRFLEAFTFLGIEYLVGASILKAGWNLVTPKAETISVRVKPKSLQVEPVGPPAPWTPPANAPPGAGGTPPAS